MSRQLPLAIASGAAALVYEVVWTREVGLLVGGQIEGISGVLVVFFGGLALGTRWLGPLADASSNPLRLFALFESLAAGLAIASSFVLRSLGEGSFAGVGPTAALTLSCALLLPITIPLGGALPALLRSGALAPESVGRVSGRLVGANTLGAVAGVASAAALIPRIGLRATLLGAGVLAGLTALVAFAISRSGAPRAPSPSPSPAIAGARPHAGVLAAAFLVGVATLAYEVLATRGAMLRLGSSLYAWALVLGLFLAGLALGNLVASGAAQRSRRPALTLAAIEACAALAVAFGATSLLPALAAPASGLTLASLLAVASAVLPGALLMGAAFPFLVRLGATVEGRLAAGFSFVSAINTAGGVLGSLLAPYLLLPLLGFEGAALCCALLNAGVAAGLVFAAAVTRVRGALQAVAILSGLLVVVLGMRLAEPAPQGRVLSVEYGRQATAVVLHERNRRTLVVDGDAEASTGGEARLTEELMAALPMLLHPNPRDLLEVGFGSGITLAAAARFPLDAVHCVEIADSVLRSARFFAPDNDGIASVEDPRVRIVRGDGRAFLAAHPASYDVVVANTLHPWSVGATGLYSREYFERIERALRPGGLAVQWVAVEPLGAETLAAILRTIATVFPSGSVWWGAENLVVVGRSSLRGDERRQLIARSADPALAAALGSLGLEDAPALSKRWITDFETMRAALGPGLVLSDDRPVLEILATRRRSGPGEALALVAQLASAESREDATVAPLHTWLESREARKRGDTTLADRLEAEAEAAGSPLARAARLERQRRVAQRELDGGRLEQAERSFQRLLAEVPDDTDARRSIAEAAFRAGQPSRSRELLERVVSEAPDDALAWNLIGIIEQQRGELYRARRAFESALAADPFLPQALANAGLVAVAQRDLRGARAMLRRLREISPLARSAEELELSRAIRSVTSSDG